MTELKTLKDLKEKHGIFGPDYVGLKEIKAEAVKWVKEDLRCMKDMNEGDYLYTCADARVDWIKTFFNLTDENLKENEE